MMFRPQPARTHAAGSRAGGMSRALARDRLGVPSVLFFVLAGVAPLTVAAGVIPTAYQTTGLTGIPAAFLVIAVILAIFAAGYVAMTRHITNSGAFYAFVSRGIGRGLDPLKLSDVLRRRLALRPSLLLRRKWSIPQPRCHLASASGAASSCSAPPRRPRAVWKPPGSARAALISIIAKILFFADLPTCQRYCVSLAPAACLHSSDHSWCVVTRCPGARRSRTPG